RSKIRQWINLHERKQATEVGRRLIEREARQAGVSLKKISQEELLRAASEYGRTKAEDLYADIGYGKYSARQVLAKLTGQSIAPNAVTRFRATPSSAMSREAAEWPCITPLAPTCRSYSINPSAASTCNGAMWDREPIPSRWWCTARIVPDFSRTLPA